MAVDKSGDAWTGTSARDLRDYLREYQAGGYPVAKVVIASCDTCTGDAGFALRVDPDEGFAERTCAGCGTSRLMLDSADIADEACPTSISCLCGGVDFDVAVGFAKRSFREFKWVSIGIRCRTDGVLGSPADWKIDYSPSRHLSATV